MRKLSVFITGIAGFAGSYLAEELLAAGYRVSGAIYGDEPLDNILSFMHKLDLHPLDILDSGQCAISLKRLRPNFVFHLAAFSSVGQSFKNDRLTYRINFDGTLNMLEAAVGVKQLRRFIYVSSSDIYGTFSPRGKTLTETQPFNPSSPYAISKAAAEHACRFYHRYHELPVLIARSFNHSGPRQNDNFVIPSFAKQIAAIEAGRCQPVIRVGDLSARRDLSDVRDIVHGYRLLAEKGRPGQVYHFCCGKAVAIKSVLDSLLKLTPRPIKVKTDKRLLRKTDIPILRGSNHKAVKELGYKVRYTLKDTLSDTLNDWRERKPEQEHNQLC